MLFRSDVTPSDNYFDLLPGEEVIVHLRSAAALAQLQQSLKVTSLTDAFFDERPTYREHPGAETGTTPAIRP